MKKLILSLMICLVSSTSFAQKINIWVEDFEPFAYEDENKKIVGMNTEIVQFLLKDSGIKFDAWRIAPWVRAFEETKRTPNTMLYTVVRKPDREKLFHWIGPVSDRNIYLFKLKNRKDVVVNSLEDAKKYNVGAVRATASNDLLKANGIKTELVADYIQNVKKLLKGRVDLILDLDYSVASLVKKIGSSYSKLETALLVDSSKKYYIVLHKDTSPKTVTALQNSFKKLKESGGLKKIQDKYLQ